MARDRDPRRAGPRWRPTVAAVVVVCHFVSTAGLPGLGGESPKDTSRPFPCQDRPCGCRTYDECWAGDCCCFSLREKVAWARGHAIEPPDHAVRAVAEAGRRADAEPCPHCVSPAPPGGGKPVRWVAGVFALRCKGRPQTGAGTPAPSVPPPPAVPFVGEPVSGRLAPAPEPIVTVVPVEPLVPPPRV